MEWEGLARVPDVADNAIKQKDGKYFSNLSDGNIHRPENYATLPYRHRLDSSRNQILFTSVSSTESGPDAANTSQDTVDAVPLRIQRMPLLSEDYIKQRQASVENLLTSKTPNQSLRTSNIDESKNSTELSLDANSGSVIQSSASCDFRKMNLDPDPYSYFEMQPRDYVSFVDGHTKSKKGKTKNTGHCHLQENSSFSGTRLCYSRECDRRSEPLNEKDDRKCARKSAGRSTSKKTTGTNNSSTTHTNGFQEPGADSQELGTTETDLCVNRQPRPSLKVSQQESGDENPRPVFPISTPPRNAAMRENRVHYNQSGCCENNCTLLCCALFNCKYLCDRFSVWDCGVTLASVAIFIFDVVTDLILASAYYSRIGENEAYRFYFGLTLGLVIGPSVVIQVFSLVWVFIDVLRKKKHEQERSESESTVYKVKDVVVLFFTSVIHVFQMAVFFRYTRGIFYGMKSRYYEVHKKESHREHFDKLWRYELHDINMLRLLESFLESAPQLVLQLYIMLMTHQVTPVAVLSCTGSLLALSSMMVAIQRAIRNSNHKKQQLSILASIVMFCWRACTISSRVVAFALFLTVQPLAFLFIIIAHWLASTIWIAVAGTNFCPKKIAEYFFDGICGLIYIFCYFNVHEEKDGKNPRSRWRMLIFYLFVLAENSVLSILWYFWRPGGDTRLPTWKELISGGILSSSTETDVTPPLIPIKNAGVIQGGYALAILVAVHGFFLLGLVFMLVYYAALHPKKTSQTCCCLTPKINSTGEESATKLVSAPDEIVSENVMYSAVPGYDQSPTPAGNVLMATALPIPSRNSNDIPTSSTHSVQRSRAAVEALRGRKIYNVSEADDSDSDLEAKRANWSETVFNRGMRARKLYTRQYSREKVLEELGSSPLGDEEPLRYSPRRTDRFRTVVTPTREKQINVESPIHKVGAVARGGYQTSIVKKAFPKSAASTQMSSVIIRPGSQTLKPGMAPRSATHQGLQSYTLASPTRKVAQHMTPPSSLNPSPTKHTPTASKFSRKIPQPVESRDYSASMSCLMGNKPLSYAARRRQALGQDVTRAPSFTISSSEVVECMESSV